MTWQILWGHINKYQYILAGTWICNELVWTCLCPPFPPPNQICNLEETLWVTSRPRSKCEHITHVDLHVCKFQVISVLLFTKPARLHVYVALRPTLPPLWWANVTENACKEHETGSKVILTSAKIITLNLESHSQFAELLQCCFQAKIRKWFNFIFELDFKTTQSLGQGGWEEREREVSLFWIKCCALLCSLAGEKKKKKSIS